MKKTTIPQRSSDMVCTTPDDWILHESIPFSLDSAETRNASIGKVIASFDARWRCLALEKHSTLIGQPGAGK